MGPRCQLPKGPSRRHGFVALGGEEGRPLAGAALEPEQLARLPPTAKLVPSSFRLDSKAMFDCPTVGAAADTIWSVV